MRRLFTIDLMNQPDLVADIIAEDRFSCENNGITVTDHFADVSKMIKIGKGGNREVDDYIPICTEK